MKIVITGANGFLGKRVAKLLLEQKHHILAVVIPEEDTTFLAGLGVDIVRADITIRDTLKSVFDGADVVIHLAALLNNANERLNWLINYDGTKNVADFAEKAGVKRFIFTSSMTATGKNPNVYGQTKKKAEEYLKTKPFRKVIIRPTLLYGKEGFAFLKLIGMVNMVPFIVPVIGKGDATKQFIYVDDAARIIAQTATMPLQKDVVFQLGGPDAKPFTDILAMVLKAQGKRKLLVHMPRWIVWLSCSVAEHITKNLPITREAIIELETSTVVDYKILEKTFHVKLTPLENGIRKSV